VPRSRCGAAEQAGCPSGQEPIVVHDDGPTLNAAATEGMTMTEWAKNIDAVALFVEDLDRSLAFYQDFLDQKPAYSDENGAMFRLGNTVLFLTRSSEAPNMIAPAVAGAPGNGPRHVFAIIVDDVDAVCAELTGKGLVLLNGPEDRSWGMRTANFQDPDGYVWEIATEMPEPG
jgi:catechol 2,3-dioxygenase-like lactoylglutathione lyase family enzyme